MFIEDLESKFGTLLLVQNPLALSDLENLSSTFQYRNSLFRIAFY